MSNSVPDRWLKYKSYGEVIPNTKILAFKVPLREGVAKNLQPEQRFTTAILRQAFPQLKYIVDLTNTNRYYDQKDFIDAGVKYEKVMVPGIKVPSMDVVKQFFKVMDTFTTACGEDEIIGVHCTHGVNRTGYFICRYLVQQLGWKLTHALKAFQEARGYPVERQNYVEELKRTPCGSKIDTSKVILSPANARAKKISVKKRPHLKHPGGRPPLPPSPFLMGPPGPGFAPPRRGFANGVPFPPPRYNYGPPPQPGFGPREPGFGPREPGFGPREPGFGPREPGFGPRGPGPLPPPGPRFGPRLGHRMGVGPPMPPPMGGQIPHPRGPPRMPIPSRMPMPPRMAGHARMPGPPRLPMGPMPRLPPVKMAPQRLPLPPQHRTLKRNALQAGKRQTRINTAMTKNMKDLDFTVDTFEENLTTSPVKKAKKNFVHA